VIWAIAGLLAGLPGFFLAVYRSSRASGWRAFAWSLLGLASLLIVGVSILALTVPGFFSELR
jgi:hypothetical protein